jgi:hypothetical protein
MTCFLDVLTVSDYENQLQRGQRYIFFGKEKENSKLRWRKNAIFLIIKWVNYFSKIENRWLSFEKNNDPPAKLTDRCFQFIETRLN